MGHFMIHNFGRIHPDSHPNNSSFILRLFHDDLHNSFVTFKIDALDISFVQNVGRGRISEIYHPKTFEALQGFGTLMVELINTGEVTAEFSVSVVSCTSGLHHIPAKTVTLDPGELTNVTFKVQSATSKGGNKDCEGTCR